MARLQRSGSTPPRGLLLAWVLAFGAGLLLHGSSCSWSGPRGSKVVLRASRRAREEALRRLELDDEVEPTEDELRQAYRKTAAKYHPDSPDGDEEQFEEVKEAYELVRTSKARRSKKKQDTNGVDERSAGFQLLGILPMLLVAAAGIAFFQYVDAQQPNSQPPVRFYK
eukprot:TRINITY_DN19810_c0_g1_i1.p1 TRINITY_DN19810_c0_g1~~TRINITY_DN19810_c0_g1_i1.p1  ORF type:complete len:186 (+),score=39.56 TRINITY_DN19810_c0_g1_i1:56-559(+)